MALRAAPLTNCVATSDSLNLEFSRANLPQQVLQLCSQQYAAVETTPQGLENDCWRV